MVMAWVKIVIENSTVRIFNKDYPEGLLLDEGLLSLFSETKDLDSIKLIIEKTVSCVK